eukprot:8731929-Pyramimonas_sp.AAC.1
MSTARSSAPSTDWCTPIKGDPRARMAHFGPGSYHPGPKVESAPPHSRPCRSRCQGRKPSRQ